MRIRPAVLVGLVSAALAGAALVQAQTAALPPVAAAPPATPPMAAQPGPGNMIPGMAYGVSEVLKMYQGGIQKDVIIHYIENTALPFHLTADNIIYMQSLGVPQDITKELIQRDGQLHQQAMLAYQQQQPPPGYGQQPPPGQQLPPGYAPQDNTVAVPTSPAPPVAAPYEYDYGAPYYDYAYPYYWPPVVVGGGWGWGGWGGRYYGGWGRGFGGGFRGGLGGFHGGGGGFHGGGGGGFHGGGGSHGGGGHR